VRKIAFFKSRTPGNKWLCFLQHDRDKRRITEKRKSVYAKIQRPRLAV
jgi:hypothetical protein